MPSPHGWHSSKMGLTSHSGSSALGSVNKQLNKAVVQGPIDMISAVRFSTLCIVEVDIKLKAHKAPG
jgi:hypothetical protein